MGAVFLVYFSFGKLLDSLSLLCRRIFRKPLVPPITLRATPVSAMICVAESPLMIPPKLLVSTQNLTVLDKSLSPLI